MNFQLKAISMVCSSGQVKLVSLILVSLVNIDSDLLVKVDTKLHVPKEQVLGNKPELEFHYVTWYH